MTPGTSRALEFLSGGGEMGRRIRELDWAATPIGPPEQWSPALRTLIRVLLVNRFPMLLWWGPEYISLYNDAYRPILGQKHPWGLGQPVRECWSEIWHILQPLIDTPFFNGPATWVEDIELVINRSGFTEETHFTVAYSPVPDETASGGIGGVLATVHEITEKVVGQRRTAILRDLGADTAEARTPVEACRVAADVLAQHAKDIPFALVYLIDDTGGNAHLAASCGVASGAGPAPVSIDLTDAESKWPLHAVREAERSQVVENLASRFTDVPHGYWEEPPRRAVVLPIRSRLAHQYSGFLIAGLSSRLALDDAYRNFLELATSQIATSIANAQAWQEERKRAEALAELDRAKTLFFSNVSHEFRTPLTLMLGPIESLLDRPDRLAPEDREQILTAHRNSLRLLKLVNSLLDFSRIEAGRIQALYVPVDLAALTADLASNFHSLMRDAGLDFVVDCPPLPEPVYVDREMWEKIVLNLLSNAFKFTLAGRVSVHIGADRERAILTVSDTGGGIPDAELSHIFERFHRVEGAPGRTHEGTGIGLALIQELVRLHGGAIEARSRLGEGSAFTVALSFGHAHLPPDRVGAAADTAPAGTLRAGAFIGEAATWISRRRLVHPAESAPCLPQDQAELPLVLLADDNADMREHIAHVLIGSYRLIAVPDGGEALRTARENRPDLILTDVMMPRLDGFGLLRELRSDPRLREIPVILLSARAGEEARTEGIAAGADDYLTKPFNARELIARVRTTLHLQRLRREAEAERQALAAQFETLLNRAPLGVFLVDADLSVRHVNPTAQAAFGGIPDLTGRSVREIMAAFWGGEYGGEVTRILRAVLDTGSSYSTERVERHHDSGAKEYYEWRADCIPLPGGSFGVVCYLRDVSAAVFAREEIERSEERLSLAVDGAGMGTWDVDLRSGRAFWSAKHFEMLGYPFDPALETSVDMWRARLHPEDVERVGRSMEAALAAGEPYMSDHRIVRADTGEVRWLCEFGQRVRDASGLTDRFTGISFDSTARNRAEQEQGKIQQNLRRINRDLEQFAYSASHDLQEPLRSVKIYSELLAEVLRDKVDSEPLTYLEHLRSGATRTELLLRDLLAYTQIARFEDHPAEPVDAAQCLESALANLGMAIEEGGVTIEYSALPVVPVHPAHLRQLFQNLIGNAIKYRRAGVAPKIVVGAEREVGAWRFSVSDNGIGIPAEFRERIFGLFKRLHTSSEYPGTGIGLALCSRIVEQYHGRIWVESEPEKESTFFFTLPA